jgi:serine/threonine protein kinase
MSRGKSKRIKRIRIEVEELLEELSDKGYTNLELYSGEEFYLGHGRYSKYVVKVLMKGDSLKRPYVLKIIELDTESSKDLSSLRKRSKNEIDKLKKYWERVRGCMESGKLVNVIGIYDVEFEDTGESYGLVLMEYCEESLRSLIDREVSEGEKIKIIKGVLECLKCLNERGIIYTDLKPENILIRGGRGIIGDLGGISSLSTKSVGEVTEKYVSPELLRGDIAKVDERSLMWSIGVLMYEVFEGREMYEGIENRWERIKEIERECNRVVAMSLPVEVEVLERADAEKRYGFRIYQGGFIPSGELRIVKIGSFDAQACCGLHVKNTGDVKMVIS